VFVGAEDEDRTRHVHGMNEPHDLEERLANLIGDNIAPRLPELGIIPWRRSHGVVENPERRLAASPTLSSR
jgi:hypothetical protein